MDKPHDIIKQMGRFPDNVVSNGRGLMLSKKWKCSKCSNVHESETEIRPPAPCECGSIFFEKVKEAQKDNG